MEDDNELWCNIWEGKVRYTVTTGEAEVFAKTLWDHLGRHMITESHLKGSDGHFIAVAVKNHR